MRIGEAVGMMQVGEAVYRSGWVPGTRMTLAKVPNGPDATVTEFHMVSGPYATPAPPFSHEDILADDWLLYTGET